MEYQHIILNNWNCFQKYFVSQNEVQKHFSNLRDFRNSLKHVRDLNPMERKQGEASLEWIFRILQTSGGVPSAEEEEEDAEQIEPIKG